MNITLTNEKDLAMKIRQEYLSLGLSTTDFANKMGVHHSTIYRWENDKGHIPKLDIFLKSIKALSEIKKQNIILKYEKV